MGETNDAHVVEIPVNEEQRSAAMQRHPLAEISRSPGHFLLLKLLQREEEVLGRRMWRKESRMDTIGREIFQLCCHFFLFHGLLLTIVFTSVAGRQQCKRWWVPTAVAGCTSLAMVLLVQMKLCRYWKVEGQLQRERAEARAVTRCVQELRMKGASFDLSKEPSKGKRLKSSSVEIKWGPVTCCSRYRLTLFLVSFTALALPSCRFLLCY